MFTLPTTVTIPVPPLHISVLTCTAQRWTGHTTSLRRPLLHYSVSSPLHYSGCSLLKCSHAVHSDGLAACLVVPLLQGVHQLQEAAHYFTTQNIHVIQYSYAVHSVSGRTTSPRYPPAAQKLLTTSLLRVNIHYFSTHMQCTAMGWQPVWSYHFSTASTSTETAHSLTTLRVHCFTTQSEYSLFQYSHAVHGDGLTARLVVPLLHGVHQLQEGAA